MATRTTSKSSKSSSTVKKDIPAMAEAAAGGDPEAARSKSGVSPKVVSDMAAMVAGADLKKRELLELVATRTEQPKNKVKPFVEAVMSVLGEAIADGRGLNLQPMGKIKLVRSKDTGNATVTVARIRQVKPTEA